MYPPYTIGCAGLDYLFLLVFFGFGRGVFFWLMLCTYSFSGEDEMGVNEKGGGEERIQGKEGFLGRVMKRDFFF